MGKRQAKKNILECFVKRGKRWMFVKYGGRSEEKETSLIHVASNVLR